MSLPQPPILFDATPETILREVQDLIRVRTKLWDDIEKTVSPETVTVANFMRPILDNENEWIARHQVLCFYASTSPSKDIREASNEAADAFHGCEVDLYLRQDVYRLASSLLERHRSHPVDLGAETLRWLEKFQFRFIQNGCALESDLVRDSVREGLKQLEEYQRQFRKNLHDDESGIWLSDEDLRGVPKDFFRRVELGKEENEGKFWVPMKIALVTQILKYAETETTRRRVSTLHQNRLNDKNIPLHRNMVLLRNRLARELGFSNHAAFRCQERMIDQPEKILSFLNEVRVPLVAQGRKEVARLLNLKRADSQSSNTAPETLFYWDHQYYDRLADEQETNLVLSDVSDYFELHQTLRGLMDIYEHLFAIGFQEIKLEEAKHTFGEKAAYFKPHEDCRVFGLWDGSTDSFLGFMYFDFHPRPGKYNHAGHYLLQPVRR
jgi:metallopeptidase MepB